MKILVFLQLLVLNLAIANPSSHILSQSELSDKLRYYKNINTLRTQFKQTKKVKDLGIDLLSEGELSLVFPEQVNWTLVKPAYTQLKLDNKTITLESGELGNRKTTSFNLTKELDPSISKSLLQLLVWLRIDVVAIHQMYEVTELSPSSYTCKPRNSKDAVFEGLDFFLHPKGHIERLVIKEKSGDNLMISFSDPKILLKK